MFILAYPSSPEDFLEGLAVSTFIDGLQNREGQQALRLADPNTVVNALARALKFDAAKRVSKNYTRVRELQPDSSDDN